MNSKVKLVSHRAYGYRNPQHYITAIYHYCAQLPLPACTFREKSHFVFPHRSSGRRGANTVRICFSIIAGLMIPGFHSEKLEARPPVCASTASNHDTGAMQLYQGRTVSLKARRS